MSQGGSLYNMKPLSEFATISQARAYEEKTKRLISADTMRILLLKTGLYSYFKEHGGGLQQATFDTLSSRGEFNFMEGHRKNVSGLFDLIVSGEEDEKISKSLVTLKSLCIAEANLITKPYSEVTDEEWTEVQLAKSPTSREAICPGNVNYIVIKRSDKIHLEITPTSPVDYDDEFVVTCSSTPAIGEAYSSDGIVRATVKVPKGSTDPIAIPRLRVSGLLRLVKIEVKSKYQRDFEATARYGT